MNWKEFEKLAKKTMSRYFNAELVEKTLKASLKDLIWFLQMRTL
jgi:hypothetical protein